MLSLTAKAREWIKASRAAREDWLSRAIRSHLTPAEQEELAKAVGAHPGESSTEPGPPLLRDMRPIMAITR